MINLLSPESKRQIRAARVNVTLRSYCTLIICTAVALGGIFGIGWWITSNDKTAAIEAKNTSKLAAASYLSTRKVADDFAKDLSVAKGILASNISFNALLTNIAAIIPKNVILNNLSLASSSTTTPVDISARAKTPQDAVALKNSLEDSPIFENVSISNITQADPSTMGQADDLTKRYPISATLKVQFSKKPTTGVKP